MPLQFTRLSPLTRLLIAVANTCLIEANAIQFGEAAGRGEQPTVQQARLQLEAEQGDLAQQLGVHGVRDLDRVLAEAADLSAGLIVNRGIRRIRFNEFLLRVHRMQRPWTESSAHRSQRNAAAWTLLESRIASSSFVNF